MTVRKSRSNDGTHVRRHEERKRCDRHLLVQVLEQTEHLGGLLEGLAKAGVTGTTVLDRVGMGRILLESGADVPARQIIRDVLPNKSVERDFEPAAPPYSSSGSTSCLLDGA